MSFNRRSFIRGIAGAGGALAIGANLPSFLQRAAWAGSRRAGSGRAGEKLLIVIQLSGGNDGLNTVVPHREAEYREARPKLRIDSDDVLTIDRKFGFHPACRGLADALEAQRLAIVQGVGYEQPNRSHFESMDIWHSCRRKEERGQEGWLGRAFDRFAAEPTADPAGIFLGQNKLPAALIARDVAVPSIESPDRFRLQGDDAEGLASTLSAAAMDDPAMSEGVPAELADFLQRSTGAAIEASRRIEQALSGADDRGDYPDTPLADKLRTVGRLIDSGLGTRVFYVELDGFDTHSQQPDAHRGLLDQWSGGVAALLKDLEELGRLDDTLILSFSEFGRRVAENASEGTDHGAAAPLFLAGGRVKPGLHGELPSLTDLDDGDLKFHTDFRRVYATILEDWLGWDSEVALGEKFRKLELLRS